MRRYNPFILSTVSLFAVAATPAAAQQTQADQSPPQTLTSEQEIKSGQDACGATNSQPLPANCTPANTSAITVTGSRIRRPNLESPLPVTSVGGQEFFQTGNVSVGDKLAELPQIASTFTQANSTRFLGTGGLNLLDLRGLGTARTLVLVNGRRHVGGDVLSSGVSVDINTIPTDLIDRVDVVTGGNSAVYGSDAIAGVVNFVLKQNYQGFQVRGQGGLSKYGDAGSYFVSGLAGQNFAGGRGNIAVNVEYAHRDQAWGAQRPWLRTALTVVDADPAGTPNGSDGIPDRILNHDFRSASFNNTGLISFGAGGTFGCGTPPSGPGVAGNLTPTPYSCPYQFTPEGNLIPITGIRTGIGPTGQFIGGTGEGFFNGHQIQIYPNQNRYNINLIGHFDVSPALVPFVEAKFSRTESTSQGGSGPAFITGAALGDQFQFFGGRNREQIRLDNPYLTTQARNTICGIRAQRNQTCPNSTAFSVVENLAGLPNRVEEARRDTFRIVGGLRGDLGNSWNYEVSVNYGRLKERTKIEGNLDTQRMLLALDAVRDPATGNIVCRSQISPAAQFGGLTYYYYYAYGPNDPRGDPNAKARLAADVAACTPVNVLGGQFTEAQKAYLLRNSISHGKTSQLDVTGFISGDSSKFFNLPGGPVGLVLGAEYRRDNLAYDQDPEVQKGYTFYNAIPSFAAPKAAVKEAFGELRVPILKDLPLINELEVDGAARVSDYKLGSTGTVWAYNATAIYSPIEGFRLRGNFARAVRAPNQSELFTPFGQNFALIGDPCSTNNLGAGSPTRAANCLAAGIPAGTTITYNFSLPFKSGGNQTLKAEVSNSITVGGVVTPRILPGFSASVDYYDIKLKKAIQSLTAQQIINACYDQATLDNPFCSLFKRGTAAGTGGAHEGQPFGIADNTLQVTPQNFAKLKARGIDAEIAYRHQIGSIGRLDTRLNYTHVLNLSQYTNPSDPNREDRLASELGNPKDAFNWNNSIQHGRFTLGYQLRYIGKMYVNTYETWNMLQGRPPENADYSDQEFYPSRWYHDLRLGVDVGPKYNFYMGVDNVTNVKPPYATSGIGGGSGIYDAVGRFYYAGVQAKF